MAKHLTFISPAGLFNAGMAGMNPCLKAILAHAAADEGSICPPRRDRIVKAFFDGITGLPRMAAIEPSELANVWQTATPSRQDLRAERLGKWCRDIAAQYDDEAESLFANRCAAMFIELYGNAVTALPTAV